MSHVDEGALHAYLDGALDEYPPAEADAVRSHLESCAECSGRLEAERLIRADAHAMLGLAAPDVDMPSLEELRAYVKRTRPQSPTGALRMYRLGWAASVVLALGTGWMLRGGQLQRAATDGPARLEEAADSRGRAARPASTVEAEASYEVEPGVAEGGVEDDVVGAARGAEAATFAQAAAEAEAGSATDEDASPAVLMDAFADRVDAPETSAAKLVAEGITVEEAVGGSVGVDRSLLESSDTPREVAVALLPPEEPEPLPSAADAAGAGAGEQVADTRAATPDAVATDAAVEARRAAAPAAVAPSTADPDEQPRVVVTSELNRSALGVVRETSEEDERVDDEPTLVVPGLEVISVTNLGEGAEPIGVRVVQVLEDGASLEIYHLELGVEPGVLPPLDPEHNEALAQGESGWVVMRGPRSEDELAGLLAQLFPR